MPGPAVFAGVVDNFFGDPLRNHKRASGRSKETYLAQAGGGGKSTWNGVTPHNVAEAFGIVDGPEATTDRAKNAHHMGSNHTEDDGHGLIRIEGEFRHFAALHLFPHRFYSFRELVVSFLVNFPTVVGSFDFRIILVKDF